MSKRELEEAIRQRKLAEAEAKKLTRELEQQKTDMQSAEENAARAQEEAEKARAEVEIARESALAAQERTAALERELKALRERPVDVAVETVDASEGQIAAAVLEARKEAEALRAELERAKKSARVMDNKALAEFGVLFRQAQETVNRLVELLDEVGDENRAKVYRALSALARMIEEQAGEEVKSDG